MFRFLITVALLSGMACTPNGSSNVLRDYTDSEFQPGQVWRYQARPGEDSSTLTVLKVETHPKTGVIVHIAAGRRARPHSIRRLYHRTWAPAHFRRCAPSQRHHESAGRAATDRGSEGYREWRRAFDIGGGGVFTTTVAECVGFVEQAANPGRTQ